MEYCDYNVPENILCCRWNTERYLKLVIKAVCDWSENEYLEWEELTGRRLTRLTPAKPEVCCRECGCEMHAIWQDPLTKKRAGLWMITCLTPGCWMEGFTLSRYGYELLDLSVYRR